VVSSSSPPPRLSVILIVGAARTRAQRTLTALCGQTAVSETEIVVVDIGPVAAAALAYPPSAPVIYRRRPDFDLWAEARAEGISASSAPVIAFLEDHCFPEPGWARAVIDAHEGPWAAVGYGFANANPESYVSRAAMLTDYGLWHRPATHGPARLLPGNNISYKREHFDALGSRLGAALSSDFVAQAAFRAGGLEMMVEPAAEAAHQNFSTVWETGVTNYVWSRLMAARRAEANGWTTPRRVAWALATPATAPVFRVGRLVRSLRGRRPLWGPVLMAVPVLVVVSFWAAIGESLGYLLGVGDSERSLTRWELDVERVPGA
jgi:hypothetical protein